MRNRYAGNCLRCGTYVAVGHGHFEKVGNSNLPLHQGRTTRCCPPVLGVCRAGSYRTYRCEPRGGVTT